MDFVPGNSGDRTFKPLYYHAGVIKDFSAPGAGGASDAHLDGAVNPSAAAGAIITIDVDVTLKIERFSGKTGIAMCRAAVLEIERLRYLESRGLYLMPSGSCDYAVQTLDFHASLVKYFH